MKQTFSDALAGVNGGCGVKLAVSGDLASLYAAYPDRKLNTDEGWPLQLLSVTADADNKYWAQDQVPSRYQLLSQYVNMADGTVGTTSTASEEHLQICSQTAPAQPAQIEMTSTTAFNAEKAAVVVKKASRFR